MFMEHSILKALSYPLSHLVFPSILVAKEIDIFTYLTNNEIELSSKSRATLCSILTILSFQHTAFLANTIARF
jgi:Na+/H+ antiporter NhaD/arsenite permease-like protein